jgi:hypothetical protein
LLNACVRDDGSVVLYTLALMTSTFVDVTTFTLAEDGPPTFAFNDDGTRIATGRRVLNLFGDETWALSSGVPTPGGSMWAGESLVLWSEPHEPGHGAAEMSARDISDGTLAWVLSAVEGASGFHTVVAAP